LKKNCIVVGSGVSGSVAALLLAQYGYEVTLIEKTRKSAPLMRGYHFDGLHIDTGVHYVGGLGPKGSLTRLLTHLGLASQIKGRPLDPHCFDLVERPNSQDGAPFAFASDYAELEEKLCERFPAEREGVAAYLAAVRAVFSGVPHLNPNGVRPEEQSPFGPWGDESLEGFFQRHQIGPELGELLSVHANLYGTTPDQAPFGVHAAVVGGLYESAWGIEGGGLAVADALANALVTSGVELLCGRAVEEVLLTSDGCARGVRLSDGEVIGSDTVIFSGHPKEMMRLTPDGPFRPVYRKRLAGLEESESAVMLAVSCEDPAPTLRGGNIYLLPEKRELEAGFDPEYGTIYLTPAYKKGDPKTIGGFLLLRKARPEIFEKWAASRRGDRPKEYADFKKSIGEGLIRRLEKSYPCMVASIRRVQVATPLTFRDYTGSANGGVYGVKHRLGQYNPMPPTRVRGLLLTGQATALPGLVGAIVSAYLTVGHLVGVETLLDELRKID
jgi:all-trans-retinol 13,14-reductase